MVSLTRIVEGDTALFVPKSSLDRPVPTTFPVFFNPAARLNRDLSVVVALETKPRTFLDLLCGVGARGMRIANEGSGGRLRVIFADFNKSALAVVRRNIAANQQEGVCEVVHSEANAYLYSRYGKSEKLESVDIDPFGTPAPYLQGALLAVADSGTLSFTATDGAVLCGVYPQVCMRRYGALSTRNDFMHETAIRILVGYAARSGGVNDIGVEPVLAHSTLHYIRVFLRVRKGATASDASIGKLGYVYQCNACFHRSESSVQVARCSACGRRVRVVGPLWCGGLLDERIVKASERTCTERGWTESARTLSGLVGVDAYPSYGYSLERACAIAKVATVGVDTVIEELRSIGRRAMRQPFEAEGIKSDATRDEFLSAVMSSARRPALRPAPTSSSSRPGRVPRTPSGSHEAS